MKLAIKPSQILIALLIFILIFLSAKKSYNEYMNKSKIKSLPMITSGYITNYYEIGFPGTFYLEYHYTVNGDIYKKEVIPNKLFKKCEDDKSCINKIIYVRYFANDPSISVPILDSIN